LFGDRPRLFLWSCSTLPRSLGVVLASKGGGRVEERNLKKRGGTEVLSGTESKNIFASALKKKNEKFFKKLLISRSGGLKRKKMRQGKRGKEDGRKSAR